MDRRSGAAAGPPPPPDEGEVPAYFALVMATGVIAVGCAQQGLAVVPGALWAIAAVAYVVLWVQLVLRIVRSPRDVARDLTQHARGFQFLTIVASTNILGGAAAAVHGWWGLTWVLWWASLPLWLAIFYLALFALVLSREKLDPAVAVNGTWFLLTVSTESIAVVGALLLGRTDFDVMAFATVVAFSLGLVLYLVVMTMVFIRWALTPLDPTEVDPPSWIAAGSAAIVALAGSNLLAVAPRHPRLERMAPFIEGVAVLAWATSTFWIPLMIAIGVWRHVVHRYPLTYHPSYWALVFPIGMYGVSTHRLLEVLAITHLEWAPRVTLALAGVGWLVGAAGLLRRLARRPRQRPAVV